MLRALLGPASLQNRTLVGVVIDLFDDGYALDAIVRAGLGTAEFRTVAGSGSHEAVVRALYKNVVGVAPPASELAYYSGLLNSGALTQTQLGVLAATVDVNSRSPELMGIATTGLDFLAVPDG